MTRTRVAMHAGVTLVVLLITAAALRVFPWAAAAEAIIGADPRALVAAALLNLAAHTVRGGAWHCLLQPRAAHRLSSALIATVAGEAVSCVSIAVGGEVVRTTLVSRRDGVPFRTGAESIAASRLLEGVALAGFIAATTPFLPATPAVMTLRYGSWSVLAVLAVLVGTQVGPALLLRVPPRLRHLFRAMFGADVRMPLGTPLLLGLLNWLLEWATFHVCIVATCGPVPFAASLLALLAANVGGILRLTPGNAGVLQASVAAALVPMGVAPANALAAGLLLQTVQSLPVMAVGFLLGGSTAWRSIASRRAATLEASLPA